MALDKLQKEIRKRKNPTMVTFCLNWEHIPQQFLEAEECFARAYRQYAASVLTALRDIVPAARFDFASFALAGVDGLQSLCDLLSCAADLGYYVLLDAPETYISASAAQSVEKLLENWRFDGLLVGCYSGSDSLKPFIERMQDQTFDLFVPLRTGNKSAPEIQELLTGTRLVYTAAADLVKRLGEGCMAKCGYSRVGGMGPATSAESLRNLRSKYPALFLLIDGYDYSGANAKNCSFAFDNLGHGAVACAGESILAAWKEECGDPIALSVEAAERMKKNLLRYITVF